MEISANELAQPFYAGSNAGGYSLTEIKVDLPTAPGTAANLTAALWSSNEPNTKLQTLTNLGGFLAGLNTFTPAEPIRLEANTRYHLVIDYNKTPATDTAPAVFLTASGANHAGGSPGWNVGHVVRSRTRGSATAWATLSTTAMRIRVFGESWQRRDLVRHADGEGTGWGSRMDYR